MLAIFSAKFTKLKKIKLRNNFAATLSFDGWSNVTNNPIIEVSFSTANRTYLADILNTTGSPHTAENLAEICEAQIVKCEEEWGVVISCLVTDNAANILRMRKLAETPSYI